MKDFPPRIHVLIAREAPVGVVIRRGPSKRVATFLWDRQTDEFTLGQWLKGTIYERRSDLSPDGKHIIYFAMNGKWHLEAQGSWTAISVAPYLKALVLFAKGDCWHGGGLWTSNSTYWLNGGYTKILKDSQVVQCDANFKRPNGFGNECLGVYIPRLTRDGWSLIEQVQGEGRRFILEKPVHSGWTLRKIVSVGPTQEGRGVYWDQHELIGPQSLSDSKDSSMLQVVACPDWEWADVEGSRVVWAANGKLHAAHMTVRGLSGEAVLQDFTDMHFKAIEAPY